MRERERERCSRVSCSNISSTITYMDYHTVCMPLCHMFLPCCSTGCDEHYYTSRMYRHYSHLHPRVDIPSLCTLYVPYTYYLLNIHSYYMIRMLCMCTLLSWSLFLHIFPSSHSTNIYDNWSCHPHNMEHNFPHPEPCVCECVCMSE